MISLSLVAASERFTAVGRLKKTSNISSSLGDYLCNAIVYNTSLQLHLATTYCAEGQSVYTVHYLETRYSNFFDRKDAASAGDPLKASKVATSTAKDRAAAIAIAGAPRTTISLIASLIQYGILSVYDMPYKTYITDKYCKNYSSKNKHEI